MPVYVNNNKKHGCRSLTLVDQLIV